jgi:hypothetical protein
MLAAGWTNMQKLKWWLIKFQPLVSTDVIVPGVLAVFAFGIFIFNLI